MEPLLNRIEAMAEAGCYSVAFQLDAGAERSVILRFRDGDLRAPEANMIAGWSTDSASFQAMISAVRAVHEARELVGAQRPQLQDVDGGWDVGLGNVVLSETGDPACVADGDMQQVSPGLWQCPICGARARYSASAPT
jgi:hypothetical protein